MTTKDLRTPTTTERARTERLLRRSTPAQSCQLATLQPLLRVASMSPHRPTRREFLIGAGSLLILAPYGCGEESSQGGDTTSGEATSGETRTIEHALGTTEVPVDPRRVIVMDGEITLDPVAALGIEPVGAAVPPVAAQDIPDQIAREIEGEMILLGSANEPNLEEAAALNPDLIIGAPELIEGVYGELSQISPTVAVAYEQTRWKERLRRVGAVFGRQERAESLRTEYDRRVADLRADLRDRLDEIAVTVARATDLGFRYLTVDGSFPGTVLDDVGLSQPTQQKTGSVGGGDPEPYIELSFENIPTLEADYIFLLVDEGQSLEELKSNPLWEGLEGQKIEIPSGRWIFGNILTAKAMLDDLEEYLVREDTT